jgi:hypothetical protein
MVNYRIFVYRHVTLQHRGRPIYVIDMTHKKRAKAMEMAQNKVPRPRGRQCTKLVRVRACRLHDGRGEGAD